MTELQVPPFLTASRRSRNQYECFDPYDISSPKTLQALLGTEDAADQLIAFLQKDTSNGKVVWLSHHCFLSKQLRDELLWFDVPWLETNRLFLRLFYFKIRTATTPSESNKDFTVSFYRSFRTSSPALEGVIEALLRLLAMHKTITRLELGCYEDFPSALPFVASLFRLSGLQAFVSQAQSTRQLSFHPIRLSPEQWRIITSHCNRNVTLEFGKGRFDWLDGGHALIDALQHNTCPNMIRIFVNAHSLRAIPRVQFRAFMAALKENTSLEELSLLSDSSDGTRTSQSRLLLFSAIAQNCGLQKLDLSGMRNMVDQEWKLLWGDVTFLHPTLKTILLPSCWQRTWSLLVPRTLPPSRRASLDKLHDLILIRSICSNTVLCKVDFGRAVRNQKLVQKQIQPVLEINRFRRRLQAIEEEQDQTVKAILFASALLDDNVHNRPSLAYLLLTENASLWARPLLCSLH